MNGKSKYLFVVSMDVEPAKEAIFNEVYDIEHIPYLMEVPGVRAVTRAKGEDFAMAIAGRIDAKAHDGPRYIAIYEIDSADVVKSDAWATAVEKGRWGAEVRPYTSNRRHQMFKVS